MSAVMHSKGCRLQSRVQTAYRLYITIIEGKKGFATHFLLMPESPPLEIMWEKGKGSQGRVRGMKRSPERAVREAGNVPDVLGPVQEAPGLLPPRVQVQAAPRLEALRLPAPRLLQPGPPPLGEAVGDAGQVQHQAQHHQHRTRDPRALWQHDNCG